MEENKYVYAVYTKENGTLVALHKTLKGIYNRLSHRKSDEYKLFHIVNGDLSYEITNYEDLYDGCKVAQVQYKSGFDELLGRDFEPKRVDYEIQSIKLND